ncbi:hypothetical protein MMYC01_202917 [Madurella mycetomatis]|uniref:Uncharacterized protein n=1 Tax=Madurella mycetomatis TaxID=100816 RepID=A0A175WBD5_9PEZI|nr:hypothetical protein MMYC01_202917 [Madurella mycetomatis]
MAKSTTAARLRRTFHYPSDDNDDDALSSTLEVLDEQEQESLIATLTSENKNRNASFLRFLSALPALSSIPFFLGITSRTAAGPSVLLSLLGLSSLAATGWLLHRLDTARTGFALLDARNTTGLSSRSGSSGSDSVGGGGPGRRRARELRGILGGGMLDGNASPLERHLPHLNVGLAVLAFVTGLLERARTDGSAAAVGVDPVLLGALPGIVYAVVVGAKLVMAGVDPERELSGLRYEYKGA